MADINLLPEISEQEVKKSSTLRGVNIAAVVVLLFIAAVFLGFFGYWLYLNASAARIASQTKDAEAKIVAENRKEITRRALVDKLDEAQKLLSTLSPFSIAFDKTNAIYPGGSLTLTESEFKHDDSLVFTAAAGSSGDFATAVEKLEAEKKVFGDLVLTSLRKEKAGEPFVFTIDAKFLKKGVEGLNPLEELEGLINE